MELFASIQKVFNLSNFTLNYEIVFEFKLGIVDILKIRIFNT